MAARDNAGRNSANPDTSDGFQDGESRDPSLQRRALNRLRSLPGIQVLAADPGGTYQEPLLNAPPPAGAPHKGQEVGEGDRGGPGTLQCWGPGVPEGPAPRRGAHREGSNGGHDAAQVGKLGQW